MTDMRFRRKKNSRYRGSQTHGGGSMKKRRGAGHRGGRGNAGSSKRGDSKKPTYVIAGRRFGRFGFTNSSTKDNKVINIGVIQSKLTNAIEKGRAKKAETYNVDLTKMKIDKLLGAGDVTDKFTITVEQASPVAIEKVEAAGGKVVLPASAEPAK